MDHVQGNPFRFGVFDRFHPGRVRDFAREQNHHVQISQLVFDAPFLAGEHFQGNSHIFGRFNIFIP
jgi:hypothetical protein